MTETILVTGGASFIGSHLVEALLDLGHDVRVADDFSSGEKSNLGGVWQEVEAHTIDLRQREAARTAMMGVDRVFHLACAQGGRGYNPDHPADCATNFPLDTTVFEMAVDVGVDHVTYASSACVYPIDIQEERVRLAEPMANTDERGGAYPDEVYGWAKLMGELSLQSFHEQHGIGASIARLFTAYGPRENETHAVSALLAKALARQDPFEVWGDGGQTRNFTYVDDIVEGLLRASTIEDGTPVNVGSDRFVPIDELVEHIFDVVGWRPDSIMHRRDKPVGPRHRAADLNRARGVLMGWEPTVSLTEGIERTAEWYLDTHNADEVADHLDALLYERAPEV